MLGQLISSDSLENNPKGIINNFTYPLLALISTFTLVIGVSRLAPIAQWAKTQNECIQMTSTENGGPTKIINKVQICNGGHD